MALSVSRLKGLYGCEEPANEIQVLYNTDVDDLCAGNGTSMSIFSDSTGTLNGISSAGSGSGAGAGTDVTGGVTNPCTQGMDVVLVLDYSTAHYVYFQVLKNFYSSYIGAKIANESGGDYRVGIVTYDGDTSVSSPAYSSAGFYQNLPAGQKIAETVPGGHTFITCWQKMTQANNTTVDAVISALDSSNSSSSATGGTGDMQPGGRAIYEVGTNEFAGQWRNDVAKFIIVISASEVDETVSYMQNTVLPGAEQNSIQHIALQKNNAAGSPSLAYICGATTPVGSFLGGQNMGGTTWAQVNLPNEITADCSETTIYDCSPIAVGWYQEVGDTTAYYWDGSSWSNSNTCTYTITLNLVNGSSTTTVDDIDSESAFYSDSDTYVITGTYGQLFTITHSVTANAFQTISGPVQLSQSTVSGSGVTLNLFNSSQDGTLSTNEFKMSGSITGNQEFNVTVDGQASATQYRATVSVLNAINDPYNASGQSQTPNGEMQPVGATPASGWTNSSLALGNNAVSYEFTAGAGELCSYVVNLNPDPSDYTLSNITQSASYSSGTMSSAVNGVTVTNSQITGSFNMPAANGESILHTISGSSDQPSYSYTLTASESVTGMSIQGAPYSQTYTGYTGDTNNFTVQLLGSVDYNINSITSATPDDSAIGSVSINNELDQVTGVVTMPQGGGSGDVAINATMSQIRHQYTVTINDNFNDASSYSNYTFTAYTGETQSVTIPLSNQQADTVYTITSVTDNSGVLTSSANANGTSIDLTLTSMPAGGGSATVTVLGSAIAQIYDYIVEFKRDSFTGGGSVTWPNTDASSVYTTVSAAAGTQHTVQYDLSTSNSKHFNTVNVTESESALSNARSVYDTSTSYSTDQPNVTTISVTLDMPSGGGSGRVNVSGTLETDSYEHIVHLYTDSTSHVLNELSEALVTTTGNGSYVAATNTTNGGGLTLTFTGEGATHYQGFQAAVNPTNSTDYSIEIDSFSTAAVGSGNAVALSQAGFYIIENTYSGEGVAFEFVMPNKDPRVGNNIADAQNVIIDCTLTAITHTFTLNYTDSIANCAPVRNSDTFTGIVNSSHNYSIDYNPSSGYTSTVTGAAWSGKGGGIATVVDANTVSGSFTMPSNGGTASVNATGTSAAISFDFVVIWSNTISNASWINSFDTLSQTLSGMTPGETRTISQTVYPSAGYGLATFGYADNHNNIVITSTTQKDNYFTINASVTMPLNASGDQSGTITASGTSSPAIRQLTINYVENIIGAYHGTYTAGSGSGAGSGTQVTSEVITGQAFSTGSLTRNLIAESGYNEPTISGVNESSAYITNVSVGSTAHSSTPPYHPYSFNYEIPATNTSATITITGSASQDCNCTFIGVTSNPSTYGGSNGSVTITVSEGCDPEYSWTVNGSAYTPSGVSPTEYRFMNLSAGSYTIVLTDGSGCQWTTIFNLTNPTTTTTTTSGGGGLDPKPME